MTTGTSTSTYSVVDVRKVIDCFAADYDMVAQSTSLKTQQRVTDTVHDVKLLAERGYLSRVDIVLSDASGGAVRAAKYLVSTSASLWSAQRPGNTLWPRMPDGSLTVVVSYTQKWRELGQAGQQAFQQTYLRIGWSSSSINLAYPSLTGQADRRYASNAYGVERTSYC